MGDTNPRVYAALRFHGILQDYRYQCDCRGRYLKVGLSWGFPGTYRRGDSLFSHRDSYGSSSI